MCAAASAGGRPSCVAASRQQDLISGASVHLRSDGRGCAGPSPEAPEVHPPGRGAAGGRGAVHSKGGQAEAFRSAANSGGSRETSLAVQTTNASLSWSLSHGQEPREDPRGHARVARGPRGRGPGPPPPRGRLRAHRPRGKLARLGGDAAGDPPRAGREGAARARRRRNPRLELRAAACTSARITTKARSRLPAESRVSSASGATSGDPEVAVLQVQDQDRRPAGSWPARPGRAGTAARGSAGRGSRRPAGAAPRPRSASQAAGRPAPRGVRGPRPRRRRRRARG